MYSAYAADAFVSFVSVGLFDVDDGWKPFVPYVSSSFLRLDGECKITARALRASAFVILLGRRSNGLACLPVPRLRCGRRGSRGRDAKMLRSCLGDWP